MIRKFWLALPVAALFAVPAHAELSGDRFWLTGSGLFGKVDTQLRINGTNGNLGTEVDLEKDLGLRSTDTLPVVLAGARLSEHWRVELEYLGLRRSGSTVINRPIIIGDTTYNTNANIASSLRSDTYRIGFGYSFIRNEKAELGASVGAHITRFKTGFVGSGSVNGATSAVVTNNRAVTAPLPTLGIYGSYQLSKMFALNARVDYLSLKISNIKGELIDTQGGVTARIFKNFSLGAGYRYVKYNVRATTSGLRGEVNYDFKGPFVSAELAF